MNPRAKAAFLAAFLTFNASALAGPDWVELGDAGSRLASAQRIAISGQLESIAGTLNASGRGFQPDLEDCFLFTITDPTTFSITTSGLQVQLSLFKIVQLTPFSPILGAFGLLANNNGPTLAAQLTQFSTDSSGDFVATPGDYLLAVSLEGRSPISDFGDVFNIASPTEISGADGPGGMFEFTGWTGSPIGAGEYTMEVVAASGSQIPGPTGVVTLLVAGAAFARRRRRVDP